MSVYRLDDNIIGFPDPTLADDDGLLAIGGDLSVSRLLLAYNNGIFPWYEEGEPLMWWCPKERFIIKPSEIHVSHSMKKFIKKHQISCVLNRDFSDTMHRCRTKREHDQGTWITDAIEKAYKNLYDKGFALSFDTYIDDELAGGLYGVCIGKCFFGESMYTDIENGSKLALIGLSHILDKNGYLMIDCQFPTDHLKSMGGISISYSEYMAILREGIRM